ncbi:hypothetical protein D3C78_1465470 [compost metagenome]
MIGVIVGGLYWVLIDGKKKKIERVEIMSKGYEVSKGIIVSKHSYKGHSIRIKYCINDVEYETSTGWDKNPQNLGVGDSIFFKYATLNPNIIISELESDYLSNIEDN